MTHWTTIMTTTLPDGSFDIFQWVAWKQNATLTELYIALGNMESLEIVYRVRVERGEGDEYENTLKAEFFLSLQADIITQIAIRQGMPYFSLN